MPTEQQSLPRLKIDGHWVECQPGEDYGVLGTRYVCRLRSGQGGEPKKLLIRRQRQQAHDQPTPELQVETAPAGKDGPFRPVAAKTYPETAETGSEAVSSRFLQQDITNTMPIKQAVLRLAKEGRTKDIWQLFYRACKCLNQFGKSYGKRLVPLQLPASLAVASDSSVVLLDAEIRPAALVEGDPTRAMYEHWFGSQRPPGFASADEVSLLHSRAVLRYFRELLAGIATPPSGIMVPSQVRGQAGKLVGKLDDLLPVTSLDQLEKALLANKPADDSEQNSPDLVLAVEDSAAEFNSPPESAVLAVELSPRTGAEESEEEGNHGRSSWLLPLSILGNLALIALVIWLWLQRSERSEANSAPTQPTIHTDPDPEFKSAPIDPSLMFSRYCVIFPTHGTDDAGVEAELKKIFPGQIVNLGGIDREKLVREELENVVKQIQDLPALLSLFDELAKLGVEFKGYADNEADKGLRTIIERGGVFTLAGKGNKVYGSLLQSNGVKKMLIRAQRENDQGTQRLLDSLRVACSDYGALNDVITVTGRRSALLLKVDPTAKGHEEVRVKILGRSGNPVFVPRPLFELFDAVDPAKGGGKGEAEYALTTGSKTFWRHVAKDDRQKINFEKNPTNHRMKWQEFDAGKTITWTPIGVLRRNGRTDPLATFDIGVLARGKIVVFRNQNILIGESREEVSKQARTYLEMGLQVKVQALDDALSITAGKKLFTGTLIYSYLAQEILADPRARDDVEVQDLPAFQALREKEDRQLQPN